MRKPIFTGIWKFRSDKSSLQVEPPDESVFVIDHRDPVFKMSRTHVVGGKRDTLELDLTTDGKEISVERGDLRFRSRTFWDGEILVFETNLVQGGKEGLNIVRYTLTESGDSLSAVERFRSKDLNYDNTWVLDKQK